MPTIACAKCSAQLRIPDGASGKGKCPKCGTIFVIPARPAPQPAFEVVEDEPTPAAKQASPAPAAPAKPLDQTNDDDRPRTKKRSRDDDYDDDDDRPRAKRRRDDDDDYDDRRPVKKADPFGSAAIGAQLISIGLFCYAGMFAVLALYMLISMFTNLPEELFVFPALAGITMAVLTIIGASYSIAGPTPARGLAIATAAVSAVQIILTLICHNEIKGLPVGVLISGIDWLFLGTTLWILDMILPLLIYMPQGSSFDIFFGVVLPGSGVRVGPDDPHTVDPQGIRPPGRGLLLDAKGRSERDRGRHRVRRGGHPGPGRGCDRPIR